MMNARRCCGFRYIHIKVDMIQDHLHDNGNNGTATGASCGQYGRTGIVEYDGRCHGRQRSLARFNGIGHATHQTIAIGGAGLGGKIIHFVIQQKPCASH